MLLRHSVTPNQSLAEIGLEAVRRIHQPLLLYGIVESVLLIILLTIGPEVPGSLLPIVYALSALVPLIAIAHFCLQCRTVVSAHPGKLSYAPCRHIYPRSDSTEFVSAAEERMRKARRLIFIGTGLNILTRDPLTKEIMCRAQRGLCQFEIFLADPTSPAVETRLIEEELGDFKPPVGRPGMIHRLDTLLRFREELGKPEGIKIHLFTNYPTFALLIMDTEYFIYPYGYARLGNFSPVLQFSENNPSHADVIAFLNEQYARIKACSRSADIASDGMAQAPYSLDHLHAFALYFIPPEDSPLYQFGTRVIGFDVRQNGTKKSPWARHVGGASRFGFHLTLCDVLYYETSTALKHACAEVEYLVTQFRQFEISNLHLQAGFPDSRSCSLVLSDESGSLEALHHELVHRVYRLATASNYSIGLAKATRDDLPQRSALMIERYRAPYILGQFKPHFTLLSQIAPADERQIIVELEQAFTQAVPRHSLRVGRLSIMTRSNGRWMIAKEINLR